MSVADLVSIVVPTHNRRSAVSRLLAALADQEHPLDRLEVIVVADGCTDDTCQQLSEYRGPLALRLIEQPGGGPAAARNAGAAPAKGEWLLFLDDDVVPSPRLVSAHLRAHRRSPASVVVGPYPPAHVGASLLDLTVQSWWRKTFEELLRPGCRHGFASVLTGNLSIPADLFERIGGFDPRFQAHEDYELGMRLILASVPIVYEPDAVAHHHHSSDIAAYIKRKADEGRADVMLLERYPELATELPLYRLMRSSAWKDRVVRALAVRHLLPADLLTRMLRGPLSTLDRAGLRKAWRKLRGLLETYAYLYAVADRLGGVQGVASFCRSLASHRVVDRDLLELDLGQGFDEAERQLDRVRPAGARVRYQSQVIGVIPSRPGAEPLRGAHLRAALAREMAAPLLEAMATHGAVGGGSAERRRALGDSLDRQRHWFGSVRPGEMWFEQYSQWRRFERPEQAGNPTAPRYGEGRPKASAAMRSMKAALKVARRPLVDAGAFAFGAMLVPGLRIPVHGELVACALVFAVVTGLARPLVPYLTFPVVLLALAPMLILLNSALVGLTVLAGHALGLGIEASGVRSIILVACMIGAVRVTAAVAAAPGLALVRRLWAWVQYQKRGGTGV